MERETLTYFPQQTKLAHFREQNELVQLLQLDDEVGACGLDGLLGQQDVGVH